MSRDPLSKVYEPNEVERAWLARWLAQGSYHAEAPSEHESFSIVIPPPNVTGVLHMGHALNNTLQDILCRYRRMKGFNVLWVPGTDHAGIATQNVVEKKLAAEGTSRHELGRQKFVKEVWRWKEQHGSHIIHQLQRLGASCDWQRERFTMDAGLSRAVATTFVRLYHDGLIYRDKYLINWCPRCHTALSDLEVEHEEQKGHLWHIRYPLASSPSPLMGEEPALSLSKGQGGGDPGATLPLTPSCRGRGGSSDAGFITVATTRPETMLGDTAVAVHPEDERYRSLIGKSVILPLVEREIPIISDHRVDREFGSGAVKITPAHDFSDFVLGNEHDLERINVLTEDGRMNDQAINFQGQDRFECRKNIVAELEAKGYLVKVEDHHHAVGHCYRCKAIAEPYLSLQWFVKTKPLAAKALQAVREGRTRFFPAHWTKIYEQWMENIQDWCISRQIWWGHRIPAWYCTHLAGGDKKIPPSPPLSKGGMTTETSPFKKGGLRGISTATAPEECPPTVSKEKPPKCPNCGDTDLVQDPDVLDTWFSSALWPFSTLGWPDETAELKTFYPTSVLVTAFDIIFFWVARMMMMGLYFMKEVPFRHVYIHAIVRDAEGKKMSKSKGNVIDPLEIMDRFGTDAFRFTLAALATQGRDIRLSEEVIQGYRNFCNKIWNAARFALMNLGDCQPNRHSDALEAESKYEYWIRDKLRTTIKSVEQALENYQFDVAAKLLYQFFWSDFCDWYLEYSKGQVNRKTLYEVLETSLRLLHPFMPFITEEIWHRLAERDPKETIEQLGSFPEAEKVLSYQDEKRKAEEIAAVELTTQVIKQVRSIRGDNGIPPSTEIQTIIYAARPEEKAELTASEADLKRFTRSAALKVVDKVPVGKGMAHAVITDALQIFIPLQGLVDFDVERKRLDKEIKKLASEQERIVKKLQNREFIAKAPEEVVAEQKERQEALLTKIARLRGTYQNLSR